MPLPSPVPLSFFLVAASVVFGLAGLVWLLPYSVPIPDTWVTVLLLLSITLGATGIGGVTLEPGKEYKYVANTAGDCSSIANESGEWVHECNELSPQEQGYLIRLLRTARIPQDPTVVLSSKPTQVNRTVLKRLAALSGNCPENWSVRSRGCDPVHRNDCSGCDTVPHNSSSGTNS